MSGRLILVVDDSALIRQVISDALAPAGHQVVAAADGAEALARIAETAPDLIIADVLMPVMDGWALCEEVRRLPATHHVPFIFLTTERDVPKRIKAFEMDADDYVCKPFSKEELVARAERLLRRASRQGTDAGSRALPSSPAGSGLYGHTDHIAMADLLQLLSGNGSTGTLSLRGESVARIFFRDGQIIDTGISGLRGRKALFRIMAWPSARFEFEPGEPGREPDAALAGATSSVLMEGFAHLDELRDLMGRLPPGEALLRVPPAKAGEIETTRLSTAERILLFTAGARGASLRALIDTVPEEDREAYAAVEGLLGRGLLEVAPSEP